jgi:hypothetical protein
MTFPRLVITLLVIICFAIAGYFEPQYDAWKGSRRQNALSLLIGDSRRLFANHFYAKADAYFHGGYYPTIFDVAKPEEKSHMEESTEQHEKEQHQDADFLEKPKDWIEAFGRNFFPSHHNHLGQSGDFREILPWLRLTAELDPQKVETYTVAAFTLRTRLNRPKEAEEFLREGLRANPDSYEILYELSRLRYEQDHDPENTRNLLNLALKKWQEREAASANPDLFARAQILAYCAKLEEEQGDIEKTISILEELKKTSPFKVNLESRIRELQAKQSAK